MRMKKRKLYLYQRNSDYEGIITFLQVDNQVTVEKTYSDCLIVKVDEDYTKKDFSQLREFIVGELLIDFVGFYEPLTFDIDINEIIKSLKNLNPGIYDNVGYITEICLEKNINLKQLLKTYYYNLAGIDNVNTVLGFIENNFNASLTSKRLYLHRNTLNYRLDNFQDKCEMNIRDFRTALALFLLFKR